MGSGHPNDPEGVRLAGLRMGEKYGLQVTYCNCSLSMKETAIKQGDLVTIWPFHPGTSPTLKKSLIFLCLCILPILDEKG